MNVLIDLYKKKNSGELKHLNFETSLGSQIPFDTIKEYLKPVIDTIRKYNKQFN